MGEKAFRMDKFTLVEPITIPPILSSYPYFTALFGGLISCVVLTLTFLLQFGLRKARILKDVPVVGISQGASLEEARQRFRHDSKGMLLEGYEKNHGSPFYVPTPMGNRLMIPSRYVEELKNEPNERADFPATFVEMFEGWYTTIGTEQTLHPRVIKDQLNQYLPKILPDVDDEIQEAISDLVPPCDDWVEVDIMTILTRIVARASSRMFGGTALSRNEAWTDTMINFTTDSFLAAQRLKDFPAVARPIASWFIPELKRVFEHFSRAEKLIIPMYKHRRGTGDREDDLLQWMMDNAEGRTDQVLSAINLHVAFAAIHTSAVAVTHIVYDLCAYPEYLQPLRDEMQEALGGEVPTKKALLSMPRLDSFMRESQRFNPLLLITYERLMRKDFTFADGFTVPARTQVGVPAHAIGFNSDFYPDAGKFDGNRFYNNRKANPQTAGQQSYTAANLTNMSWGYGRHACPGRWFADAEIKVILIHLLAGYEVRLPDGKPRPASIEYETQNLPDRSATVMIRRLQN